MSKYSITLTKTTEKSDFTIPFSESLSANKVYEIGLVSFSTYNNIHNITRENNLFRYTKRVEDRNGQITITPSYYPIKPGAYELEEIISMSHQGGGYFSKDVYSGKVNIHLPEKCQIDFSEGDSFHEILGFEKKVYYGAESIKASNLPKVRSVHTINIKCDLLDKDNILYSFPITSIPARGKIDERMNPPLYLPITKKPSNDVNIRILDQDGNLINFNGSEITIFLHLREI
jgi:hypothetical protein